MCTLTFQCANPFLHIFSTSLKNRCQITQPNRYQILRFWGSLLQVSLQRAIKEEKWCSLHCTGTLPLVFLTGFVDTREIIIDRALEWGNEGWNRGETEFSCLVPKNLNWIPFSRGDKSSPRKKIQKRGTLIEVQMKSSDCSTIKEQEGQIRK